MAINQRIANLQGVSVVLSKLARGYRAPNMVGLDLFPLVGVEDEQGKVPQFSAEAFEDSQTIRAPRAESNVMQPDDITYMDYSLDEHDQAAPVDWRENNAGKRLFRYKMHLTRVVQTRIQLKHEAMCASLAQDTANYISGNHTTLSGSSQWTHASSLPINDVETGKDRVRTTCGMEPNLGVISAQSLRALRTNSQIREALKTTNSYMKNGGKITAEVLADLFDLEKVVIARAFRKSGATRTDLWLDSVVLAYVAPPPEDKGERTEYDPTFGYTFRLNGLPVTDEYAATGNKVNFVRNTDMFTVRIVGADAGYVIKDTNV